MINIISDIKKPPNVIKMNEVMNIKGIPNNNSPNVIATPVYELVIESPSSFYKLLYHMLIL
ncbi:hypothetical protein VQL36_06875 [Chengkuizengella sp. SCS-71B]|uniref:hypothetical protein n=1 Tax=Chengkuizengella sp. SCS-71B TaxID=3115290 RepID=UPI0032C24519